MSKEPTMSIGPNARVALIHALEETAVALDQLGYSVKEIPPTNTSGASADLKFSTRLGGVEVVYCTSRQIRKRTELEYEVAGAITAYCALYYTLNPPPGA
jgi:hypothetical protein